MAEMSNLDRAFTTVGSKFMISQLNPFQIRAISEFVKGERGIYSPIYLLGTVNPSFTKLYAAVNCNPHPPNLGE